MKKKEADKKNKSKDEEQKKKEQAIKVNPNPRANENIPADKKEKAATGGIGSEITDGEDGYRR